MRVNMRSHSPHVAVVAAIVATAAVAVGVLLLLMLLPLLWGSMGIWIEDGGEEGVR